MKIELIENKFKDKSDTKSIMMSRRIEMFNLKIKVFNNTHFLEQDEDEKKAIEIEKEKLLMEIVNKKGFMDG